MDTAWIALIGTLLGGVGLKIVEKFLARGSEQSDLATKLREELRKDLSDAREEARLLEHELDKWKEKYYLLFQEHLELKSEMAHQRPVQNKEGGDDW